MFSTMLMFVIGCLVVARIVSHPLFWLITHLQIPTLAFRAMVLIAHVLVSAFCPTPIRIAWLVFLFATFHLIPFLAKSTLTRVWRQQSLLFLDRLLLAIQAGASAKNAFRESLDRSSTQLRFAFEKHPQVTSPNIRSEVVDIENLTFETHRVVEKFQALRRYKALQARFGRKSSAALLPARAQALFMCLIYLIVSIPAWFLSKGSGVHMFLFSGGLFLSGSIWVFHIGRRIRWKVQPPLLILFFLFVVLL